MDDHATDELLRILITTLNRDLMTGLNPEVLISTGNGKQVDAKETTDHLVLIGASHLKRTMPHLKRMGYGVTDITCPGRSISASAVCETLNQMRGVAVPANAIVVLDLFGNSSSRWEDEDGTLATAVKSGEGYHMPGPVTVCGDVTFRKLISIVMPVVNDASGLGKIFIPPLPRYVFGACCQRDDHCTNGKEDNFPSEMLGKYEHLRTVLKTEFQKIGVAKHWVMEGWKDLLGGRGMNRKEDIVTLRHITGADNVHYTREGYENLAMAIHNTIVTRTKISADKTVSGLNTDRKSSFFWRGFVSPNGSTRPRFSATGYKSAKRGRLHPYRGGGGRGRRK
jgi:hypothetical protein